MEFTSNLEPGLLEDHFNTSWIIFSIEPGYDKEEHSLITPDLSFTWTFISYEKNKVKFQLNFTNPYDIQLTLVGQIIRIEILDKSVSD